MVRGCAVGRGRRCVSSFPLHIGHRPASRLLAATLTTHLSSWRDIDSTENVAYPAATPAAQSDEKLMKNTRGNNVTSGHAEPSAAPRPLRVMVADDDRDTVIMLTMLLRDEGHEVRSASTGR